MTAVRTARPPRSTRSRRTIEGQDAPLARTVEPDPRARARHDVARARVASRVAAPGAQVGGDEPLVRADVLGAGARLALEAAQVVVETHGVPVAAPAPGGIQIAKRLQDRHHRCLQPPAARRAASSCHAT